MRGTLGWGRPVGEGLCIPPGIRATLQALPPGSLPLRGWQTLSCVLCGTTRRSGNWGQVMAAGGWAPAAAGVPWGDEVVNTIDVHVGNEGGKNETIPAPHFPTCLPPRPALCTTAGNAL